MCLRITNRKCTEILNYLYINTLQNTSAHCLTLLTLFKLFFVYLFYKTYKMKTIDKRFVKIYDFLDEWIKTNSHTRVLKKDIREKIFNLDENYYKYLSFKKINLIIQEWCAYRNKTYMHLHNGKQREFLIY